MLTICSRFLSKMLSIAYETQKNAVKNKRNLTKNTHKTKNQAFLRILLIH